MSEDTPTPTPSLLDADAKYSTPLDRVELSRCRQAGCGADIIWVISPTGAKLCLNMRPVTAYGIVLSSEGPRAVKTRAVIDATWSDADAKETDRVFVSHWTTCKNPPARDPGRGAADRSRGRRR